MDLSDFPSFRCERKGSKARVVPEVSGRINFALIKTRAVGRFLHKPRSNRLLVFPKNFLEREPEIVVGEIARIEIKIMLFKNKAVQHQLAAAG